MPGNWFFVLGGVLVLAALGIAFFGIRRNEKFPSSRPLELGVVVIFAAIVVGTMSFAVVKANQEQRDRQKKLAAEEGHATTTPAPANNPGGQPQTSGGGNQQAAQGSVSTSLDVSSPADGSLSYTPNGLQAQPGNVTITYDNPSPVPHSIAVATANGNVLGQVQPFTNGKQSVTLSNLAPGKYVFFCTVPGHRQAGMQGDLTVLPPKGSQTP
jgi:plastocyanin